MTSNGSTVPSSAKRETPKFAPSAMPDWDRLYRPGCLPAKPNGVTFIDVFCGLGGSSLGLAAAGYELKLGANHWARAIETHAANFTHADHLCADVSNYDLRRLPPADVAWFSPICTEMSPAGRNGRRKRPRPRPGLGDALFELEFESLPEDAFVRTRMTCYDVIRAMEVWRYQIVFVENVVELAWDWVLFQKWLEMAHILGYEHQIVCLNAAHVDGPENPSAAQWRDRMFIVFRLKGIRELDLEPRPWAWCDTCGKDVQAVRAWKDTKRVRDFLHLGWIGKYRKQYEYHCPEPGRHESRVVAPYVRPAAAIIDWSDLGPRICDRDRKLAPSTWRKVLAGEEMIRRGAAVMTVTHGDHGGRMFRPNEAPLPARTVKVGEGLVTPPWLEPYVVELRGGGSCARPVSHPLATMTARGNHHGLVTPGPLDSVALPGDGVVIPYRRGKLSTTRSPVTRSPVRTIATRDSAALLHGGPETMDPEQFHFRMLTPEEQARAQRIPDEYVITGGSHERTMQAGNAVPPNLAFFLGERAAEVLCRA